MRAKKHFIPDLSAVRTRSRGYIPHWERPDATYFVTYCLADAIPRHAAEAIERKRRLIDEQDAFTQTAALAREYDRLLDDGRGRAYLRDPRIAETVIGAWRYFDHERYELLAWCVMPNHVHVIVQCDALASVLHAWKSFTGHRANEILRREGPFWHREYFDRIIRDEADLADTISYVLGNPVKAGLRNWPWIWSADGDRR